MTFIDRQLATIYSIYWDYYIQSFLDQK